MSVLLLLLLLSSQKLEFLINPFDCFCFDNQGFEGKPGTPGPAGVIGPQVSLSFLFFKLRQVKFDL